jgi:DnaJ-class molecular chaperone
MDREKMSNLCRGRSIGAAYQISVDFGNAVSGVKVFLEINQSKTRMACGGHVSNRVGTK